jgi:N-acetylglucosamine-6-phosphate deacetylase
MTLEGILPGSREPVVIRTEGGRISEVRSLPDREIRRRQSALPFLSPGFLDMQVNGARYCDYHLEDFSAEQAARIVTYLDSSGTTQHIATMTTSPKERILRNLRTLIAARAVDGNLENAIPGIHIEGPFISGLDGPRGAHDAAFLRPPDIEEVKLWQEAAEGLIRMITLSPEWENAPAFIAQLTRMGIVAAIGHTAATARQIRAAVDAGARVSTHLGNGSHTHLPRLDNYLWEQLAEDRLWAGIISDGFHLPDSVLKVFTRVKGPGRLVLVSDVAHPAGCEPGIHPRGNIDVRVFEDGHLGLPGTEILAGAGHLLDWDIPHFARVTGLSLGEVIPLVTVNPARLLGLPQSFGTLEPGAPANLVLFRWDERGNADGDTPPAARRLQILKTIRAGRVVYGA